MYIVTWTRMWNTVDGTKEIVEEKVFALITIEFMLEELAEFMSTFQKLHRMYFHFLFH